MILVQEWREPSDRKAGPAVFLEHCCSESDNLIVRASLLSLEDIFSNLE